VTGQDPELQAEVERLERIAQQLGEADDNAEILRELADQALATADRISQLLPKSLDPDAAP